MTFRIPAGMPATCSFRGVASLICALATLLCAGCNTQEPIVVEQVPKEDIGPAPVVKPVERTDRMLAAIIPHGDTALFFKVTGPEQPVAGLKADFLSLVQSVKFEGDKPAWTLPEGWTQTESSGERLATMTIPGDPPLEGSVTTLPYRGDDTEFRMANVTRWRQQMGLRPLAVERLHAGGDLNEETNAITLDDGTKVTLVNIAGQFSGGMMPPMMASRSSSSGTTPPAKTESDLTYDVPEGWEDLGKQGIASAAFTVGEVKTTVTPLSADASPLLPNVNRWRTQVQLPEITQEQLDETLESITLGDGEEGHFVLLTGPEGEGTAQAILGTIAYRDDTAWFVKMIGNSKDVVDQQSNFKSFVASLRFPQASK